VIEHKAFTFKKSIRNLFEVLQHTAFELVHMFVALVLRFDQRFFASDPPVQYIRTFLSLAILDFRTKSGKNWKCFNFGQQHF